MYDKSHRAMIDIDINPAKPHKNKDGTMIPAGVTHVHEWKLNSKGDIVRGSSARLLSSKEIEKYGKILKAANKDVKFL